MKKYFNVLKNKWQKRGFSKAVVQLTEAQLKHQIFTQLKNITRRNKNAYING